MFLLAKKADNPFYIVFLLIRCHTKITKVLIIGVEYEQSVNKNRKNAIFCLKNEKILIFFEKTIAIKEKLLYNVYVQLKNIKNKLFQREVEQS